MHLLRVNHSYNQSLVEVARSWLLCPIYLGVVHKGRPQKNDPFSYPLPPVRRCPHLTNPPSPLCGRPHLASYTALWSDSEIAGAVKIRCSLISSGHFTPTPCGLICGSCN